ncbi:hypothetical protein T265_06279 [Opisthorchis viverrini]|uniref:Uncharacterized protein n=1 Tax=Opisthorchis viverrini TaxID=6198 RepID=A0A075AE42_OPIVI|nr:hypothetical protein T265_06279 [Opisthorchis viverrini]KER26489.1 hypothetical protein T265_06279 [Opisthorchis viverrini]
MRRSGAAHSVAWTHHKQEMQLGSRSPSSPIPSGLNWVQGVQIDVCASQRKTYVASRRGVLRIPRKIKSFSFSTLLVTSCRASERGHEDWDTARLTKPRQHQARC